MMRCLIISLLCVNSAMLVDGAAFQIAFVFGAGSWFVNAIWDFCVGEYV